MKELAEVSTSSIAYALKKAFTLYSCTMHPK